MGTNTTAPKLKQQFDAAALLEQLDGSDSAIAQLLHVDRTTIVRWRHRPTRLHWQVADRYAITIGLHPLTIWPDWTDPDPKDL